MVNKISFVIPTFGKADGGEDSPWTTHLSAKTASDLKKGLGTQSFSITQRYLSGTWLYMMKFFFKEKDRGLGFTIQKELTYDNPPKKSGITAVLNTDISGGGINPNLSLHSSQLDPYSISTGLSLGGLNVNINREATEDKRLGFRVGLGINQ